MSFLCRGGVSPPEYSTKTYVRSRITIFRRTTVGPLCEDFPRLAGENVGIADKVSLPLEGNISERVQWTMKRGFVGAAVKIFVAICDTKNFGNRKRIRCHGLP